MTGQSGTISRGVIRTKTGLVEAVLAATAEDEAIISTGKWSGGFDADVWKKRRKAADALREARVLDPEVVVDSINDAIGTGDQHLMVVTNGQSGSAHAAALIGATMDGFGHAVLEVVGNDEHAHSLTLGASALGGEPALYVLPRTLVA